MTEENKDYIISILERIEEKLKEVNKDIKEIRQSILYDSIKTNS